MRSKLTSKCFRAVLLNFFMSCTGWAPSITWRTGQFAKKKTRKTISFSVFTLLTLVSISFLLRYISSEVINLPFLGTQRFSDFEQLSFIWLRLDLIIDKLGLCETILHHRVADLPPSTPYGLQSVKLCELERLSPDRSIEPAVTSSFTFHLF